MVEGLCEIDCPQHGEYLISTNKMECDACVEGWEFSQGQCYVKCDTYRSKASEKNTHCECLHNF